MNNTPLIPQTHLENWIFTIQGVQVMMDYHLAELFNVETKRLNEQVKRNKNRFPLSFMFQLTTSEWDTLQSQFATAKADDNLQSQFATAKRRTIPYLFTEQGVAMLFVVLNSDTAIKVSIQIMDAFVILH
jgi:ORF6N domain